MSPGLPAPFLQNHRLCSRRRRENKSASRAEQAWLRPWQSRLGRTGFVCHYVPNNYMHTYIHNYIHTYIITALTSLLTGCPCTAVVPWLRNLLTDKHSTEQRGMIQNRLAECSPPACLSSADSSARAEPETEAAKTGNQKSKKPQPEQHAACSQKATVKVRQSRQSSMQHAMQHTALCSAEQVEENSAQHSSTQHAMQHTA